jgi:hypothetical protein
MKIVYIAHPISGDVQGNLFAITKIVHSINTSGDTVVPFVPYYADCLALNDKVPAERERGIRNDREFFERKVIDEVWLYGVTISPGMYAEVRLANAMGIPVYAISPEIKREVLNGIHYNTLKINA